MSERNEARDYAAMLRLVKDFKTEFNLDISVGGIQSVGEPYFVVSSAKELKWGDALPSSTKFRNRAELDGYYLALLDVRQGLIDSMTVKTVRRKKDEEPP